MQRDRRGDAGGSAGAGGYDYQHRVAAWAAVQIIAGEGASGTQLWLSPLVRLDCETGDPVDDIRLTPAAGPMVCVQAKRGIQLGRAPGSEFARTVADFVHHHLDRPHELLVLVVGPTASARVRDDLARFLGAVRAAPQGRLLEEATLPVGVMKAGDVLRDHVEAAWIIFTGHSPSEEELRAFLTQLWVWGLDVEADGAAEREALFVLRSQILADPTAGDAAWTALIEACAGLAKERRGADRAALRKQLESVGLSVGSGVEYHADLRRLEGLSASNLQRLEPLVTLPLPSGEVQLDRPLFDLLLRRAKEGHLLVIGEPGAGKTVALHHLARRLEREGTRALFMAVGSVAASSLGELRQELGLRHEFLDSLTEAGVEGGVLIIDALDAARTERHAQMWRDLIADMVQGEGRWSVVASVRKWDLRHDPHLRALLAADVAEPRGGPVDPEFASVSHVNVPPLDEQDLTGLAAGAPALAELLAHAGDPLRELLRNLFNLRLAAELLRAGSRPAELGPLRTRVQLLDRYWAARVVGATGAIGRQEVLRRSCEAMLSRRALQFPRSAVLTGDVGAEAALRQLLTDQILLEHAAVPGLPSQALRFAHHVLSDYAVAVVLGEDLTGLMQRLRSDPDVTLFARPSLDLLLEKLWADRRQFWELGVQVAADPDLPYLARIPFAEVAARRANRIEDLEPLLAVIWSPPTQEVAVSLMGHVAAAVSLERRTNSSQPRHPWSALAERLAERPEVTEFPLRGLLEDLVRYGPVLSGDELQSCGVAARRLLHYAWERHPRDSITVRFALEAVVATAASDPVATEALLRRAIDADHVRAWGHDELRWLCADPGVIAQELPGFVEDLYVATISHKEESTESTAMLASRIFGLSSNRRQDFELAQWQLVEGFKAFLGTAPRHAVRALERLVAPPSSSTPPIVSTVSGQRISITTREQRSSRRHLNSSPGRGVDDLLGAFQEHLVATAEKAEGHQLLEVLVSEVESSAVWARVLAAGAQAPARLGSHLGDLCRDPGVLRSVELGGPAGQLLAALHRGAAPAERTALEHVVLALLPAEADDRSPKRYAAEERFRRVLLGLDRDLIVLPELVAAADGARPDPSSVDEGHFTRTWSGRAAVLPPDLPEEGRDLWAHVERLRTFVHGHLNDAPTDGEVADVRRSATVVANAIDDGSASRLLGQWEAEQATEILAETCECWTRAAEHVSSEPIALARRVLLEASRHPRPEPEPEDDQRAWNAVRSGPRAHAARGLIQLAASTSPADEEVLAAVERLARDPVLFVRSNVHTALPVLLQRQPDTFRRVLRDGADQETADHVVGLLAGLCLTLHSTDSVGAVDVLSRLVAKVAPSDERESAFERCMEVAAWLWVWTGEPRAQQLLDSLRYPSHRLAEPVTALLHEIRTGGAFVCNDDEVRGRSLGLCAALADTALAYLEGIKDGAREANDATVARWVCAFAVVKAVADQLYFASGAFDEKRRNGGHATGGFTPTQVRFWAEAQAVLKLVAAAPVAAATHHLVETAEFFVDLDPKGVLLLGGCPDRC